MTETTRDVIGSDLKASAALGFELDDEHADFQAVCRAFVEREVMPLVGEAERSGSFPLALLQPLAKAGLLGLGHPAEHGGSGGGMLARTLLAEELAKACGGITATVMVDAYMAGPHLSHFGTEAQQAEYLAPMIRGEEVLAIAVTEPGAGSDVAGIRTSAKRVDGGWVLNGAKMFITNAGFADTIIVAAKTDPDSRHHGISTFLVRGGADGMTLGEPLVKMGWHSSDTREIVFDDCFVADDRLLGAEGRGFHQIMHAFDRERLLLAAMGVGVAQAAFDGALAYARDRQAFGAAIGTYQSIRHRLSEMATDIEAARLLSYRSAGRFDQDHPTATATAAMAKLLGARVANEVVDHAVQIYGGAGYIEETPVAMHYRDARILRIGGGSDEVQMEILAKRLGL